MRKSECLCPSGPCELNFLSLVCWKDQNHRGEISLLTLFDNAEFIVVNYTVIFAYTV